jgi:hypothetical protein
MSDNTHTIFLSHLTDLVFKPFNGADLTLPATSGRAWTFTLHNKVKGTHITLRSRRLKGMMYEGPVLIEVMNGSDNNGDFVTIGKLDKTETGFAFTKKADMDWREKLIPRWLWRESNELARQTPAKVAQGIATMNWLSRQTVDDPTKWVIIPSGHCGHCSRKLTDPKSVETGIGPFCRTKLGL